MTSRDNRALVERYLRGLPADFDVLSDLQHDDFVEEFPQSGELIRGSENFRAIHERYPGGTPDDELQRVTGSEDRWVVAPTLTLVRISGVGDSFTAESKASYPDGSEYLVVTILELKEGRVLRARTYFAPVFEAPSWRAKWVELTNDT